MSTTAQTDQHTHILVIEGQAADLAAIRDAFARETNVSPRQPIDEQDTGGDFNDLSPQAVQLSTAADLKEAYQKIETAVPDLVIADMQLEDGNGIELLQTAGGVDYPVVLMSGQQGEQIAVEAIKAGAIDYVVKTETTLSALPQIAACALHEWKLIREHQQLQHQIAEIPQHKQRRLGRELHDGLGQQITGLGLLARSLAQRLTDAPRREREMAERLASGLEQALAEVRTLARGLVPVQTDAHGLVSALKELANRVSKQSGLSIELRFDKPILISNNETATHVYRIVQEAITNAIKHAQATKIIMVLEADEDRAVVEVRDDGKGLPDHAHAKPGLGFRTMFHRCRLFGGNLDIFTHPKGGTRMRCCFPLHPDQEVD